MKKRVRITCGRILKFGSLPNRYVYVSVAWSRVSSRWILANLPCKGALCSYGVSNSTNFYGSLSWPVLHFNFFFQRILLDAFALSQKVSFSCIVSVRPSFCPRMYQARPKICINRNGNLTSRTTERLLTLQRGVTSTARHSVNITCRGVTSPARHAARSHSFVYISTS